MKRGKLNTLVVEQLGEYGTPVTWVDPKALQTVQYSHNERNQCLTCITGVKVFDSQVPVYTQYQLELAIQEAFNIGYDEAATYYEYTGQHHEN